MIQKNLINKKRLQNLKAIHTIMTPMNAQQPKIPNPMTIPKNRNLLIINLKDWVFTITLHPNNTPLLTFLWLSTSDFIGEDAKFPQTSPYPFGLFYLDSPHHWGYQSSWSQIRDVGWADLKNSFPASHSLLLWWCLKILAFILSIYL